MDFTILLSSDIALACSNQPSGNADDAGGGPHSEQKLWPSKGFSWSNLVPSPLKLHKTLCGECWEGVGRSGKSGGYCWVFSSDYLIIPVSIFISFLLSYTYPTDSSKYLKYSLVLKNDMDTIYAHTHNILPACSLPKCPQQPGRVTTSATPFWWHGPMYLSHNLQPPRIH